MNIVLCFILRLNNELIQDWDIFELMNFDLENMEKKGSLGGDTGGTGGECCGYKTDGMLYIREDL